MDDIPFGIIAVIALIIGGLVSIVLKDSDAFSSGIIFAVLVGIAKFLLMI